MDRSWRDLESNPLDDENKTKWQKFKEGGYSYKHMTNKYSKTITLR